MKQPLNPLKADFFFLILALFASVAIHDTLVVASCIMHFVTRIFVMLRYRVIKLNPTCHLLALLGGATIVVVSRLRVNMHPCNIFVIKSVDWGKP